jgi:zinc protease
MTTFISTSRLRIATLAIAFAFTGAACQPKQTQTPKPITKTPEPTPEPKPEPAPETPAKNYPEPPAPGPAKPVNFPAATNFTLSNGLEVYVVENHEVPVVAIQLGVRAGTMDAGHVADFTAAMLGEGTKSRTKAKIDEAIEFVGSGISAGAGVHTTNIGARVLKADTKLALTLIADEVMNPVFPEDGLAKLKAQAKTALGFAKSQPSVLAETLFDMVAYPEGHPYGRPFATEADIDCIAIADLRKFQETK